jgi:hypothetical protein
MLGMRKWNDLRKDKSFLKHTGSIQLGRGRSALPAINVYESGTWNFPLLAHQNFDFAQLYRAKITLNSPNNITKLPTNSSPNSEPPKTSKNSKQTGT